MAPRCFTAFDGGLSTEDLPTSAFAVWIKTYNYERHLQLKYPLSTEATPLKPSEHAVQQSNVSVIVATAGIVAIVFAVVSGVITVTMGYCWQVVLVLALLAAAVDSRTMPLLFLRILPCLQMS